MTQGEKELVPRRPASPGSRVEVGVCHKTEVSGKRESTQEWNLLSFPEALAVGASQIGLKVEEKAAVG